MSSKAEVSFTLPTQMTIESLETLRADLLGRINSETAVLRLDARELLRIDTAGVQLLLAGQVEMQQRSGEFRLQDPSPELQGVLATLGLEQSLGGSVGVKPGTTP